MVQRICEIVRAHAGALREKKRLPRVCERALWDISTCRTAVRGGHVALCKLCGHKHPHFNSCRNRHCPQCQGDKEKKWVDGRVERSVPVGHHQVVFTLPSEFRPVSMQFPAVMYRLLFRANGETLNQLAATRLNAKIGFTSVLHTWSRDLSLHPHVHNLVTGGGLQEDAEGTLTWKEATRFLFPVSVMRRVYRAKFLEYLTDAHDAGEVRFDEDPVKSGKIFASQRRNVRSKSWVVHVDAPQDRPVQQALRYLGRYVYRVAISDSRVVATDPGHVTFRTRGGATCTLAPVEFVRRLTLHVLPSGFRKVRHYGLYAPANNHRRAKARELVSGVKEVEEAEPEVVVKPEEPRRCSRCGGLMVQVETVDWLISLTDREWHRQYESMLPWVDL